MTVLLDLLYPYPVLEILASSLTLGDLFNLSKVNASYRAALHGYAEPDLPEETIRCQCTLRPSLLIGMHRTPFWENLKAKSQLQCSEPGHKRGLNPKGCLICSMPVCEACIIKASFAQRKDTTFQNRHRSLCSDCWDTGNHNRLHPVGKRNGLGPKPYTIQAADGELCDCTAKDGILCLRCRSDLNTEAKDDAENCYGMNCASGDLENNMIQMIGRVCLWCCRQLPGSRSRAESRRDYDARHLFARSHSSYDRPPEEERDFDTFEAQRMMELDALSRRKRQVRGAVTPPVSIHDRIPEEDSPEGYLDADYSARAAEAERWQASEATRRPEWTSSPRPSPTMSELPRYEEHTTTSDVHVLHDNTANQQLNTAETREFESRDPLVPASRHENQALQPP